MTQQYFSQDARIGHQAIRLSPVPPAVTLPRPRSGLDLNAGHRSSHVDLLSRVPRYAPSQHRSVLSGIVVPTARSVGVGSGLALASRFAEAKGATLVIIRSGAATQRPFPRAMAPRNGRPTVVIDLPDGAEAILPTWQSNEHIVATLHRDSDLGFKRNLGQLIARMCGWDVMLFLDDDIRSTPASDISVDRDRLRQDPLVRLDHVLADFAYSPHLQAAGYFQRDFDDNSVVCHARKLVGLPQETFISGGALAVRCAGPLPLFSAAYNEDWLYFLHLMLNGIHTCPSSAVKYIGTIHQDAYYPFLMHRARSEELGDLLAEGLFNLVGEPREDLIATASTSHYWEGAVERRRRMIIDLLAELGRSGAGSGVVADAESALHAALAIYAGPPAQPAEALAEFFLALLNDIERWSVLLESMTPAISAHLELADALAVLGLERSVTWCYSGAQSRHQVAEQAS